MTVETFRSITPPAASTRTRTRTLGTIVSLAAAGLIAALYANLTACSLVEKVSADQCNVDADCARLGVTGATCKNNVCTGASTAVDAGSGPWSCLGHVPNLQDVAATPVTLTFPFLDLVTGNPTPGVNVQACAKLDLDCASPLSKVITSDAEGIVNIPLMAGFDGYLKTTWAPAPPTLCFINPPVTDSTPRDDTDLVTSFDYQIILQSTIDGGTADPALGTIFSNVGDCNAENGEGVVVTLDSVWPKTKLIYEVNGLPALGAKQTDASGNFVVIDVPPGNVTLTATLVSTGQRIGQATGFVRANTFSYIFVVPSP